MRRCMPGARAALLPAAVGALIVSGIACGKDTFVEQRRRMVVSQLVARGISDRRVLDAMRNVPRHLFVPEPRRREAYEDHPLAIGAGQTISQPYMVGIMTECLALKGKEKVLEIGTGSGYQAAVLSGLARDVYTIEIVEELGRRADSTLKAGGFTNVHVKIGDGFEGWKEHAPYDGIIITCAVEQVPPPLLEQLAVGGRLVLPMGETLAVQQLKVLTKRADSTVAERYVLDCVFVPMTGKHGWK